MIKQKRSPLKAKPLRNPGQSLDEQIRDLISDYYLGPVLFAVFLAMMAALELWKYYYNQPPVPRLYSVVAGLAIAYAAFRYFEFRRKFNALKLGRDGEKAVGQFLEALRERGYHIFHDVVGEEFNLDHVMIGPAGIFTIETKMRSKPLRGRPKVEFDGETIFVNGFQSDRDPVIQAKAQASWLRELLNESTGRKFEVRPIIVYPGWYVDYRGPKKKSVWVLNPKQLPSFLDHEPSQLSPEDIHLASFHLSRFVRTS